MECEKVQLTRRLKKLGYLGPNGIKYTEENLSAIEDHLAKIPCMSENKLPLNSYVGLTCEEWEGRFFAVLGHSGYGDYHLVEVTDSIRLKLFIPPWQVCQLRYYDRTVEMAKAKGWNVGRR